MQGRLKVTKRKPIGWTISGTLPRRNGPSERIRVRAKSNDYAGACEEAAKIESDFHGEDWHGPKGGAPRFKLDAAIEKYLAEKTRSPATARLIERLRLAIGGDTLLSEIGQDTITKLKEDMFKDRSEMTVLRCGMTPLLAILGVAKKHSMLTELPVMTKPVMAAGRTDYFLPVEAERLIAHAAPHLKPLLELLFCTGMRAAEAIYLDWRDVRLQSGIIVLHPNQTKARKRRVVKLPPRAVAALASIKQEEGKVFHNAKGEVWCPVFLTPDGEPYHDTERQYGGQMKKAWKGALKRAGLLAPHRELTAHTCRHSWASWHYALYLDPLRLMVEGGWSHLHLVERYAHLLPDGHEQAVRQFWGLPEPAPREDVKETVAEVAA